MSPSHSSPDVLGIIERAYELDAPPERWLHDIAECAYAHLGRGIGLAAFFYRVTDDDRLAVDDTLTLGMEHLPPVPLRDALEMLPPDFVRKSFVGCDCITQSEALDATMREQLGPMLEAQASMFGARDLVMLGGMDPSRHGIYLGAYLPEAMRLAPDVREMWRRVAVHLTTADRLRRTLRRAQGAGDAVANADAIVRPDGKIEHAQNGAHEREAREALRDAVRRVETARGAQRREKPVEAVAAWKGLVSSRWSLVDHFESDGKRYIVARRNDARVDGLDALTDRERQVVAFAALGHGNKLVAYEMGVSPSTVGVLLHRAARKLGVTSREALIEAYASRGAEPPLRRSDPTQD